MKEGGTGWPVDETFWLLADPADPDDADVGAGLSRVPPALLTAAHPPLGVVHLACAARRWRL